MTSAVSMGISIGLGATLLLAASLKLANRLAFESTLVSLLPKQVWRYGIDSRQLSFALASLELITGALMLSPLGAADAVQAWTVVLFLCFFAASAGARTKDTPCGCFAADGSQSASVADVARTAGDSSVRLADWQPLL